jgi:hypothetical protein
LRRFAQRSTISINRRVVEAGADAHDLAGARAVIDFDLSSLKSPGRRNCSIVTVRMTLCINLCEPQTAA